ncbi:metal-sensitive transcriptional regulator [Spiractinospora alimapuensis]|uniref:metal-sensitive transcriptional regulator n=1 Tax=Spiractinospora alimapuensis TaxID=2820884 RepID=UPI001F2A1701|nr:metal-sensitive transcriptional regulator [Spiractinospora alimapuensis]QVQ51372.1 metal-sensitive transcriptional regulator [Spiractinospora alimapuensis]
MTTHATADRPTGHDRHRVDKDDYITRLKRIEGKTQVVHRMIQDDQYCIEMLTEIGDITSELETVSLGLLDEHLKHCVLGAAHSATGPDEKLKEASAAIGRLIK